ncbi:hypothetical protein [Qipengyuania profunda]|jgi:hypothetical protein|uniref:hypothetical protein n=1 Tax=Qipengyuania profunda TaxID=3113984 RepID=UPI002A188B94|nr:hypothetical protein [Qipengyuania sp. HL-TH1]WPL57419.1 hypothetical protein SD421_03030 [Qipengyuania sp. HL-TH5]
MKYFWTAGLVLTLAACGQAPNPAPEDVEVEAGSVGDAFDPATAEISLDASPQSDTQIRFVVTTNLPTPVEVMAGVALAGQKPDDVFIGHSERVTLASPRTEFVLDTSSARNALPSGEYDAEVSFYPRWGAENGNPAAKTAPELEATDRITLGGSGEDRADAERRNELQRWVMGNIGMNVPWNRESFEARLGPAEKGPSTMSRLHDAYYFPDADMTFLVNRLKNEVTVWRVGDVTE